MCKSDTARGFLPLCQNYTDDKYMCMCLRERTLVELKFHDNKTNGFSDRDFTVKIKYKMGICEDR